MGPQLHCGLFRKAAGDTTPRPPAKGPHVPAVDPRWSGCSWPSCATGRPPTPPTHWVARQLETRKPDGGVLPARRGGARAEAHTGPVAAVSTRAARGPVGGLRPLGARPCSPPSPGASSVIGQSIGHGPPAKDRASQGQSGQALGAWSWPRRGARARGARPRGAVPSRACTLSSAPCVWGRPRGWPFAPRLPKTPRKGAGQEGADQVTAPSSGDPQSPRAPGATGPEAGA